MLRLLIDMKTREYINVQREGDNGVEKLNWNISPFLYVICRCWSRDGVPEQAKKIFITSTGIFLVFPTKTLLYLSKDLNQLVA